MNASEFGLDVEDYLIGESFCTIWFFGFLKNILLEKIFINMVSLLALDIDL